MKSWVEQEVFGRDFLGVQPGLERMWTVMAELGSPEMKLGRVMIVAGTNGKGSVCAFAEAMARAAGLKVAMNSSPHLFDICERLRLNGRNVAPAAFDEAAHSVAAAERRTGVTLTGFELVTASAFVAAASFRPDVSVVEVGMGGLLDATNVVSPAVSVITPIGMDHTEHLGKDLVSIAGQKLGVSRRGVPCVVARQAAEVEEFLLSKCAGGGVPVKLHGRDFRCAGDSERFEFSAPYADFRGVRLSLHGSYQVANAAVAMAAFHELVAETGGDFEAWARRGLAAAAWPGRFDVRRVHGADVLFDGAHNGHGAQALADAILARWPRVAQGGGGPVLVAMKHDKDAAAALTEFSRFARSFIFTSLPGVPGFDPEELAGLAPPGVTAEVVRDPDLALLRLSAASPEERGRRNEPPSFAGPRVCCGSLYLVGYYLGRIERGHAEGAAE